MKVLLIIIASIILALFLLFAYSLMKISSRCDRIEEKRQAELEDKINIK